MLNTFFKFNINIFVFFIVVVDCKFVQFVVKYISKHYNLFILLLYMC